jgi:hypothetical protein
MPLLTELESSPDFPIYKDASPTGFRENKMAASVSRGRLQAMRALTPSPAAFKVDENQSDRLPPFSSR